MTDPATPFDPHAPFDAGSFRSVLADAGYTAENLIRVGALSNRDQKVPAWELRERARGGGALESLVRAFILAEAEPRENLERALAPLGIDPLIRAGILRARSDGAMVAAAAIMPLAEWYVLRDFTPEVTGRPDRDDKVLPVGAASMMAAQLTVRRATDLAVDLGCGQGFQSVACAHHASRVVATDITDRALNFTAMNAVLAGVPARIETRKGSFFEPLADLAGAVGCLVCNAPFVVAPPQSIVGYSTTLEADGAVEHIIRSTPRYLAEDGYATIVANWTHDGPDDWADRPKAWLAGSGCDAWILRFSVLPARSYALKWLEETGTPRDRITPDLLNSWCAYYDRRGIGAVSTGVVILRKRSRGPAHWVRAEEREFDRGHGSCSMQIERVFHGTTTLASLARPGDVLLHPVTLTRDASLVAVRTPSDEGWTDRNATLTQHPGFPSPVPVSPAAQEFLGALRPGVPVLETVRAVASRLGRPPEHFAWELAVVVTKLYNEGYLVPAQSHGRRS